VLAGDPVEEVGPLEERPGQDIVLTGSITLGHTLIRAGLAEQHRLLVHPVVQGRRHPSSAGSTSTRTCGSLRVDRCTWSSPSAADRAGPELRGTRTT
jgi:hypothetical protein